METVTEITEYFKNEGLTPHVIEWTKNIKLVAPKRFQLIVLREEVTGFCDTILPPGVYMVVENYIDASENRPITTFGKAELLNSTSRHGRITDENLIELVTSKNGKYLNWKLVKGYKNNKHKTDSS